MKTFLCIAVGLAALRPATAEAQTDAPEPQTPAAPEPQTAASPTPTTAPPTPTPTPTAAPETAPMASWVDHRVAMTRLELGYRASFVPSSGFDPFSGNDLLPEFYLAATRTLFVSDRFSFAAGLAWDNGGSSSTVRQVDDSSLRLNRLTVPLEGRAHFGPWGYAFVRVAPGVAALQTQLTDASAPGTLSKTQWLFATDLSAGYAWLVYPRFEGPRLTGRMWLQADVGYAVVAQEQLTLGPDLGSGNAQHVSGVDLGPLSMNGAFFRIGAAASF